MAELVVHAWLPEAVPSFAWDGAAADPRRMYAAEPSLKLFDAAGNVAADPFLAAAAERSGSRGERRCRVARRRAAWRGDARRGAAADPPRACVSR